MELESLSSCRLLPLSLSFMVRFVWKCSNSSEEGIWVEDEGCWIEAWGNSSVCKIWNWFVTGIAYGGWVWVFMVNDGEVWIIDDWEYIMVVRKEKIKEQFNVHDAQRRLAINSMSTLHFNIHKERFKERCLAITKAIQCVNTQFNYALSRLMTHHHVNIKRNDSIWHAMTQPDN